jgi:hypothetical protein
MSRVFPQIREKKGKKGKFEAAGRAIFSTIVPECINCAQYILIILYKGREGKNLRFPEEIFCLLLIFGRDKTEIFVKIEVYNDPGSESSAPPMLVKRNCKKQAER